MNTDQSDFITPTIFVESLESSEFTGFLESLNNSDSPLVSITLPIAGIDPLAALELHPDYEEKFYWDHPENSISISAAGKVRELKSTGPDRFKDISEQTISVKEEIQAYTAIEHSMAGPLFLGGYSFTDHNVGKIWNTFGAARFILPEWMLIESGNLHLLTVIIEKEGREAHDIYQEIIMRITDFLNIAGELESLIEPEPQSHNILCTLETNCDKEKWIKNVEKAKDLIDRGKFEKIVLARSVTYTSPKKIKSTVVAHQLREKYPECYNFLIQKDNDTSFVGATPERLASFKNGVFTTEGLAGSTSRGNSAIEDAVLAKSLLSSEKDQNEHQFVVRAIGNSLEKFSNKIDHPGQPEIKKLKNVQHLFTPISADIIKGVQIHELIRELHPTPAVGGFPKSDAVLYIREIESLERGWYSGPVGWFNMHGFGEFAVAIRSALLYKNSATLYAGCGIVDDSQPENEWNETILKFKPLLDALQKTDS